MLEEALTPSFGCPKLVDLNIFACNKLTGKGEEIARIAKSRSGLQSISLYQTDHTDKVIRSFAKNCPSLRFIRVSHCDDISTLHTRHTTHTHGAHTAHTRHTRGEC
jgi:hypothetical protein